MTGALENLVRLNRWQLDEKRRKLADLERLAERLRADLERLDAGLEAERRAAERSEEGGRAYPAFAAAELERRRRLEASIAEIEREVEITREEVKIAFQELKKYDLALQNRRNRDRESRERNEQSQLDEIGVERYRRSRSDTSRED